jgi:DNA repair exonuclease SbcCD nuclease subunit
MAKFIHTSDWHIGNPFANFDRETGKKLNRARLTAVKSIFVYARMKDIPLILCAGDAVDNGQLAPEKNLLDLFAVINQYPDITVVMITGNHDPLMANTIYHRVSKDNYPANLHLVQDYEIIPVESMNIRIFAASTLEKNGTYNPLNRVKPGDIDESKINIGLAHGTIKNEKFTGDSFPIEPGFALEKKLDYLALGDWHSFSKINDRTFYCGTHEPLQFDDDGYPLEVTIEKPGDIPKTEKITGVRQYKWTHQEPVISDNRFTDFRETLESVDEKEIKKLEVTGFLSAENYKIYKELVQMNRNRYYEISDHVSITPGAGDLSSIGDAYIQALAQRLTDMKQSREPLPEEIRDNVIPAALLSMEQSIKPTKNEIIDKALLKLYKHFAWRR